MMNTMQKNSNGLDKFLRFNKSVKPQKKISQISKVADKKIVSCGISKRSLNSL